MPTRKSTNKELVEELEKRNKDGRYAKLILNALNNRYHDYKNPEDVICGKVELVKDLAAFPELEDIRREVLLGVYDEEADEEDKAQMRKGLDPRLWKHFGL